MIGSVAFDLLKNVLVPAVMGELLHVDFLLLTPRGLLVVDLRDVPGMIFAGEQMENGPSWTERHFTLRQPAADLYDRIAAVKALAGDVPVEGRIVFTMRGKFPKGRPNSVMRLDDASDVYPVVESRPGRRCGVCSEYGSASRARRSRTRSRAERPGKRGKARLRDTSVAGTRGVVRQHPCHAGREPCAGRDMRGTRSVRARSTAGRARR